ncbi:alpha/beta fold hydrolase [Aspergillus melleus]|uniref:alpha/beta fold hydrolase n=1 Tax=Aspergillus melleus TaxID=138277 RepID=UPI001E8EDE5C|nr:uncharacterized protein LDX57_003190 [Aspergillus melleus]KAH8425437.1 hypothetical protein LDX57_003190 [Aspergillus melleus]
MADVEFIGLSTKPGAKLSYTFQTPEAKATTTTSSTPPTLIVFLNGLGLPQTSWRPVITELTTLRQSKGLPVPSFLTYDRFGQDQTTDRDPQDAIAEDPSHGHDCLSAVHDLHQLLVQLIPIKLGLPSPDQEPDSIRLIFVANSLGCALARLYAAEYPGTVSALILLDSILANSDFVSVFPDPDAPDFSPTQHLPQGVDIDTETLRTVRATTARILHPSVPNKESISRKNLATLLPFASEPKLTGPASQGGYPYVTVLGHDFDVFAAESTRMGLPEVFSNSFLNPAWERYNQGLVGITEREYARGPVRVAGAGHFIQKDQPGTVAGEVEGVLGRLEGV